MCLEMTSGDSFVGGTPDVLVDSSAILASADVDGDKAKLSISKLSAAEDAQTSQEVIAMIIDITNNDSQLDNM
jgi:hypothetical protein